MSQSFNIDARDPTPLYAQLGRAIRFAIATGRLRSATSCPPCGSWPSSCASTRTRWRRSTRSWSARGSWRRGAGWGRSCGRWNRSGRPHAPRPDRARSERIACAVWRTVFWPTRTRSAFPPRRCRNTSRGWSTKEVREMARVRNWFRPRRVVCRCRPRARVNVVQAGVCSSRRRRASRRRLRPSTRPSSSSARPGGPPARAVAEGREAVGARGRAAARPLRRAARAGAVLDHPVRRHGLGLDRPAHHHDQLRRRADAHLRHRAGERRRRAVLDGLRPGEGGARGAGLPAGGELGGADGAARHHRPDVADRPAARPRADRGRAAEADRRAVQPRGA